VKMLVLCASAGFSEQVFPIMSTHRTERDFRTTKP